MEVIHIKSLNFAASINALNILITLSNGYYVHLKRWDNILFKTNSYVHPQVSTQMILLPTNYL
ncbi:CLUMA_CG013121, isoform A [Clunio marinus]|uniref:CLUMA_CG013121, isoform A n=1 Tax=Clunio marinus TaxID=568069 RepID=A0A1J1IHT4_9DIPT|nr:CLUMA_CG013121, isoform A [Clunio marinus]